MDSLVCRQMVFSQFLTQNRVWLYGQPVQQIINICKSKTIMAYNGESLYRRNTFYIMKYWNIATKQTKP